MSTNLLLNLIGEIGIVAEEGAGILFTLSELVTLVGNPCAALLHDSTLDAKIDTGSDGSSKTLKDTLADTESENMDEVIDKEKIISVIRQALSSLTPREEKVMRLRFGITEDSKNHNVFPITDSEIEILNQRAKEGV